MNKSFRKKKVIASLIAAAGLVVPAVSFSPIAWAQDAQESGNNFVNLLFQAADAKDKGDLVAAKAKAEEALKLNPNSEEAKKLVAEVNAAAAVAAPAPAVAAPVDSAAPAAPAVESAAAPALPPLPATAIDRAAQRQEALLNEVRDAIVEAKQLSDHRQFAEAIALLDNANRALPDNAGTSAIRDDIIRLRQEIGTERDYGRTPTPVAADEAMRELAAQQARLAAEAVRLADEALSQIRRGKLDEAQATLEKAVSVMPVSFAYADKSRQVSEVRARLWQVRFQNALAARDLAAAEHNLTEYGRVTGTSSQGYIILSNDLAVAKRDPRYVPASEANRTFAETETKVRDLLRIAHARYGYSDYAGALNIFREVLQYQPYNTEAKGWIIKINEILANSGNLTNPYVRSQYLDRVNEAWKPPGIYSRDNSEKATTGDDPVTARIKEIKVPIFSVHDVPLASVIEGLSDTSKLYDLSGKGVNIVTLDPDRKNPSVTVKMRDVTLDVILDTVTRSAGFSWVVNDKGVVEVRPDVGSGETETDFFPVNPTAVTKLTGLTGGAPAAPATSGGTIFSSSSSSSASIGGGGARPEEDAIKSALQRAGVSFEVAGSGLVFDGNQIIVTQSRRNLEKIRNILRRYNDVKQVNIEAKFVEITQGALAQLANNWSVQKSGPNGTEIRAQSGLRTLSDAFGARRATRDGMIVTTPSDVDPVTGLMSSGEAITQTIPNTPPAFPQSETGPTAPTFDGVIGSIGSWDLRYILHAIEANESSDLMSAPSLTVLDSKPAKIRIVQELIYPKNYGAAQSQASNNGGGGGYNNGGYSGGGNSSVTITAGQPQDFEMRDVGVALEVTPTVKSEDDTISLVIHPIVTEFEGFIEYGGTSVAISGNTTVTVPSGFFQPIFSVREVSTEVTIFNGATIVIGGLIREEIKTVEDGIPFLKDIPLLGAAFRSKGRTSSKRNLMVFVTANLVTPGGGLLQSAGGPIGPNAIFSSPTVLSQAGINEHREISGAPSIAAPLGGASAPVAP